MNFADIRAYPERTFRKYWNKITHDPYFIQTIEAVTKNYSKISDQLSRLKNWNQYRKMLYHFVSDLANKTTSGLTWSGVENIPGSSNPEKQGAIFISTHRNIALDPLLFNFMLFEQTATTSYTAFGDNLLNTPWLGHLLRLNGGFIVKRKVEDIEQKIFEAERLSLYIKKIIEKRQHIWIAQKSGRAKDGNDKTDSAVLSMLKLAHKRKSWREFCNHTAIIPVSMSYEDIPLDTIIIQDCLGKLDKSDPYMESKLVAREMISKKRRVHIHVGERIRVSKRNDLEKEIDESIIRGTRIWDSNIEAHDLLIGETTKKSSKANSWFYEKLYSQPPQIRDRLIRYYATPVINLKKLEMMQ